MQSTESTLLASVLQATDVMLVYLDPAFNFVWVNDAYAETCRMPASAMVGLNHFPLYPHAENEAIFRTVRDEAQPVFFKDKPFEFPDQPERGVTYWDWSLVPVKDSAGLVVGLVFSLRETTTFKQAVIELQAAKEAAESARVEAEQAGRAKDDFLAVLSHELRTPLTPVLAGLSLLAAEERLSERARDILEVARRNVELESRLIDDLLDVTRIAHGRVELDRRRVELRGVVERAIEVCRTDLEARLLELDVDLDAAECHLDADAARLQQVFWNLLKNAVKFTPPGGHVSVTCRRNDEQAIVSVRDTGIGLLAGEAEAVFDAFRQSDRPGARGRGGLGLGLTIARALVERHGGRIEVRSDGENRGAVFEVFLPLATPIRDHARDQAAAERGQPVPGLRVLLVEDHQDTAEMMTLLLEMDGHLVQTAGTLRAALEVAERERFDLVLSDLGLPDGSGLDLMPGLRRKGLSVPGIALSGYGRESDIAQSREAGFSRHLVKPVDPALLLDVIRSLAGSGA